MNSMEARRHIELMTFRTNVTLEQMMSLLPDKLKELYRNDPVFCSIVRHCVNTGATYQATLEAAVGIMGERHKLLQEDLSERCKKCTKPIYITKEV